MIAPAADPQQGFPGEVKPLSWEEQLTLLEEWFAQMFYSFCCPLED